MQKIYYLLILIFSFSVLSAQEKLSKEEKARREKNIQAGNPFARFGYKAKVATLSNGKYLEFHDLDSIVSIGTIRWHADKSIIVGRIVLDTLNPDAQPTGDTAGRWMSPDPLSEEFPSYSPYNFCLNNPMRFVDPDGRAAVDNEYNINVDTGKTTQVSTKGGDKTDYINFTTGTNNKVIATDVVNVEQTTVNKKVGGEISASFTERLPGEIRTTNFNPSRSVGSDPSADIFMAWAGGKTLSTALGLAWGGLKSALISKSAQAITEDSILTSSEFLRIENAATRIGKPINVVGSRANGTANAYSDWDYVIEKGINSKDWSKIKNSLPGSRSTLDNIPRNIDIFTGTVDKTKPFLTIPPR